MDEQSSSSDDEDGLFAFRHAGNIEITFILWDCAINGFTMGCCPISEDSMFVVLRYTGANGDKRVWRGEAWTSDSTYPARDRQKADRLTTVSFCSKIQASSAASVVLVFDGQMSVDDAGFKLHMHFDHPIDGRSLLVKGVTTGTNPLLVIDAFS